MKQSEPDLRNARNGYLLTLPLVAGCLIFYAIPFRTQCTVISLAGLLFAVALITAQFTLVYKRRRD